MLYMHVDFMTEFKLKSEEIIILTDILPPNYRFVIDEDMKSPSLSHLNEMGLLKIVETDRRIRTGRRISEKGE